MAAPRYLRHLLILLVLAILVGHGHAYIARTQDDSYITLRYAANLAAGEGLVYNPGERVEGLSNFLYAVVLALFIRLGWDPMLTAKAVGLASGCLAVLVTWTIAGRLAEARKVPWLAPLLLAVSPSFVIWSVLGLETAFYALLLLLAVRSVVDLQAGGGSTRAAIWMGALFALAAMTRPEGAMFYAVTVAFLWAHRDRRDVRWSLPAFTLVFGAFLLWRLHYYGDIVPNTYYAKTGLGWFAAVRGAKYVFEFMKAYGGPALGFFALAAVCWGRPSRVAQYLGWLVAAHLAFVVDVGGDNFAEFRFIAPILPLWYLLAAEGGVRAVQEVRIGRSEPRLRRRVPLAALVVLTLAFLLAPVVYRYVPALRNVAADAPLTDANALVTIGEWLRGIAPPETTIAVGEAGAIPYVTGWRALDAFGLSDRAIARAPRVPAANGVPKKSPAFVIARVLEWRPDFVEFYRVPGFDTVLGPNDDLLWKALLGAGYVPIAPYDRPGFVVLARPGLAARWRH